MRYYVDKSNGSACSSDLSQENDQTAANLRETEAKMDCSEAFDDTEDVGTEEDKKSKLIFKFRYQTWNHSGEFIEIDSDSARTDKTDSDSARTDKTDSDSARTDKYEFITAKSFCHFLEQPNFPNFTASEFYFHPNDDSWEKKATEDSGFSSVKEFKQESSENVHEENSHNVFSNEFSAGNDFPSEHDFNGVSSNSDFEENAEIIEKNEDITEEIQMIEKSKIQNSEKLSGKISQPEEIGDHKTSKINCIEESAKLSFRSPTVMDSQDSRQLETLWEHQDLIEQLKMELRSVRAIGLPTILEESESPRIMEDLKPWKIDKNFRLGSGIYELRKFYRSYRDRMRKFDILNYQKMYAMGFLHSENPLIQSFSSPKSSAPAITFTSLFSHSLHPRRHKKWESNPTEKFIKELYSDLEMVYVGQLCLSWEFLQWEYGKALEIWESDQNRQGRYNEVAGELQQFQVLLQRFIENEPFEGPRVENYVKNRCLTKTLLQVPVIRDDNKKDGKKLRKEGKDDDSITSEMLVEILEESIRTIWHFIRADKKASNLTLKGLGETQVVELQNSEDSKIIVEIRANLRKKERRLRDILKSENCILRKLQKRREDEVDHTLYFFSQVDMKLVWRVLNMSRITTDQLAWCCNNLNKINLVHKRINVEPTLLLFPC